MYLVNASDRCVWGPNGCQRRSIICWTLLDLCLTPGIDCLQTNLELNRQRDWRPAIFLLRPLCSQCERQKELYKPTVNATADPVQDYWYPTARGLAFQVDSGPFLGGSVSFLMIKYFSDARCTYISTSRSRLAQALARPWRVFTVQEGCTYPLYLRMFLLYYCGVILHVDM